MPDAAEVSQLEADADEALHGMLEALDRTGSLLAQVRGRVDFLIAERGRGRPLRQIVEAEPAPLVVGVLTVLLDELADSGAAWRRAEAACLLAQGMTRSGVAALFGVSRQRVSALLSPPPPPGARSARRRTGAPPAESATGG